MNSTQKLNGTQPLLGDTIKNLSLKDGSCSNGRSPNVRDSPSSSMPGDLSARNNNRQNIADDYYEND